MGAGVAGSGGSGMLMDEVKSEVRRIVPNLSGGATTTPLLRMCKEPGHALLSACSRPWPHALAYIWQPEVLILGENMSMVG